MEKCFDDVDQALADENASIPLDYLESGLEDNFQIVNAIAIAIQGNASSDLKCRLFKTCCHFRKICSRKSIPQRFRGK